MRIERTIEVHTTPVKAYKVLADPTNIPRYVPDVEDVVVTSITPRLVGTKLRMRTRQHDEIDAEVTEAAMGKSCTFHTGDGRTIRWDIHASGGAIKLVNTLETEGDGDESQIIPELERKLRTLRNAFQFQLGQ